MGLFEYRFCCFLAFFGLSQEQKKMLSLFKEGKAIYANVLQLYAVEELVYGIFGLKVDILKFLDEARENQEIIKKTLAMGIKPWRIRLITSGCP